jgi:hypothetical protein
VSEDSGANKERDELRRAWDEMIANLQSARDAIDSPELMPAPPTDRNLAEGYRYLMGFVHGAIERAFFEDAEFPVFRNAIHLINKGTIDNADAIYMFAPIDGRNSYVLRGKAEAHGHWRGEPRASDGLLAPQYLIFEVTAGCLAGDTGDLSELRPGVKAGTGNLDSSAIEVGADGSFEILLAPERPEGHTGNFIATKRVTKRPHPDRTDAGGPTERFASYVSGRQLFYDWARERAIHLTLTQIGKEGAHPAAYDSAGAAAELRRAGEIARGQMRFWNQFNTVLLETYGKRDGSDGERFMPRNKFNQPNAASGATGGGQSTNIYAGGVFELEPDEALICESRFEIEPQYIGFSTANLWGESLDFANHQSSLNGHQLSRDEDGAIRWVVAHRDPGVANWLDTTGHREGFMSPRWSYSETPPKESWPTISAVKVPFSEIAAHLPASTKRVGPEERARAIAVRQEHVKRRYRAF